MRKNPEQQLHLAVAKFLRHALRSPVFWTTFPAGGGGRMRGAFLRGMGLKAGVPDILVFAPTGISNASQVVGIELKAPKGAISTAQYDTHVDLEKAGVRCLIARSVDDVECILIANGVRLHARVTQ
jgi:hypothetical protein